VSSRPQGTVSRPRRDRGRGGERPAGFVLRQLMEMNEKQLAEAAATLEIEGVATAAAQDLPFQILKAQTEKHGFHFFEGVIEVLPDGYGFLRSSDNDYLQGEQDVYVPPNLIRMFTMATGDTLSGQVRPPRPDERYLTMTRVEAINFLPPERSRQRTYFDNLTPLYPEGMLRMETPEGGMSGRVLDMFVPIGRGQRGLIVAPPRTGKTMLLQAIANGIATNHPEAYLMVLLIDERPEEVTDMQRTVKGRVIKSTFDAPASRHVQVAEMVIEEAKRWVEYGKDVVILLDSITRLARAYNSVSPQSGRILSGGIDATALQRPKRFFGSARNVEEKGSLTIIATALIDTGSRMDDVIFEEFKGTGNMEIVLDRSLADQRTWPAIDLHKSGTRREDLLISEENLPRIHRLRKALASLNSADAMQLLLDRLGQSRTNSEFLSAMEDDGK